MIDGEGFVGDRASRVAFREILSGLRKALRQSGDGDPLGERHNRKISKRKLEGLLAKGDAKAAAVVLSAIEDFAQELAAVIRRFLRLKAWQDTQAIVIGGGFRADRIGELAIARTGILLKTEIANIAVVPIHSDPDDAGLIGAAYLIPAWMLDGYDAIVSIDIGGTNLRAGLLELNLAKAPDLSKARVSARRRWRHADAKDASREGVVRYLAKAIAAMINVARKRSLRLAPVVAVGCPGLIRDDGAITRGAQNLPGNWEGTAFHLPTALCRKIPHIGGHETVVVMHNDAVAQGLSELPYLEEVRRWGVLTIGTGLGNARLSRRKPGKRA
jgi:predicted NBD/HSP70 family sugar kinase